jgi:predicted nucleic acid-binding protein
MILADTSIWVEHLRTGKGDLSAELELGSVFVHPFVIGELACGLLRNRAEVLGLLQRLPHVPTATDDEALGLIERRGLMGRGIGYVDVHLLAAVALSTGVRLWTRDRRLAEVAEEMGVGHLGSPS